MRQFQKHLNNLRYRIEVVHSAFNERKETETSLEDLEAAIAALEEEYALFQQAIDKIQIPKDYIGPWEVKRNHAEGEPPEFDTFSIVAPNPDYKNPYASYSGEFLSVTQMMDSGEDAQFITDVCNLFLSYAVVEDV